MLLLSVLGRIKEPSSNVNAFLALTKWNIAFLVMQPSLELSRCLHLFRVWSVDQQHCEKLNENANHRSHMGHCG